MLNLPGDSSAPETAPKVLGVAFGKARKFILSGHSLELSGSQAPLSFYDPLRAYQLKHIQSAPNQMRIVVTESLAK